MALQSQTLRAGSGPRSSQQFNGNRRGGQKRILGVVLLVLIVGGLFYMYRARDGSGTSSPLSPQSAKADTASTPTGGANLLPVADPMGGSTLGAQAPTPPAPAPMSMEMTSKRTGQAGTTSTLVPNTALPPAALPAATTPTTTSGATTPPAAAPSSAPATEAPGLQPLPGVRDPLIGGAPGNTQTAPGAKPQGASAPAAVTPSDMPGLPADLAAMMSQAERSARDGKLVEARNTLNKALLDPRTGDSDRVGIRRWMSDLNQQLIFSPTVYAGDALVQDYKVVSNDNLVKIARKTGMVAEPGLIARTNALSNPNALRIDQVLKVVKGPFHAVVHKSDFRMDIFAGPAPSPGSIGAAGLPEGAEPGWVYIRSFPVGLGEKSGTPIANFTVKENSKLVNPFWANPRTGEKFDKDDPKNPIGERWIGLAGLDDKSKGFSGYGVHGTIQPESIGKEMSMGCVRMRSEDVEVVYELLMPRVSIVKIVP